MLDKMTRTSFQMLIWFHVKLFEKIIFTNIKTLFCYWLKKGGIQNIFRISIERLCVNFNFCCQICKQKLPKQKQKPNIFFQFELRILDSGLKLIPKMLFPKFDQLKNQRDFNHCDIDIQDVERFFQETAYAKFEKNGGSL